ncbi:MAG: ComEC/Rec2 family competence protein [Pyrinomonadaceae bacterium]
MQNSSHKTSFNRNPVFWLAVCFALGVLLAKVVTVEFSITFAVNCALAALAFVFRKRAIATLFISLAFVGAGAVVFQSEQQINSSPERLKTLYDSGVIASGTPVELEGVLNSRPEAAFDRAFLTLRSEGLRYKNDELVVAGNVRLFVPTRNSSSPDSKFEISNLKYRSRIRVACALEREDEYLNPGVVTRRELLDRLDIDATCSVKSPLLIEHLSDESVFVPLAWVYDRRAKLIDEFRAYLTPRAAGVMIASLLGNKNFLDEGTAELFRDGGTFHILVISGLHITFIGGLLYWIVSCITRRRIIQFAVTNLVLWAYTLSVGADVPVVRAAMMFTVISFSLVIYRQSSLLNSFGLSCFILLVWRPSDLFNPSFQLTFVSVAAIIACAYPLITRLREIGEWTPSAAAPFPPDVSVWLKRFCETLYWRDAAWAIEQKRQIWTAGIAKAPYFNGKIRELSQRAVRYIFEGLLVSFIVQLWMLPLTVVYFHRVSLASVLLNLWVGVLIAFESFTAVAAAIAGNFSELLATGFYAIADVLNWLLLTVPALFSDNGWASFRLPAYSENGSAIYAIYFIPVILLVFALNRWRPFELRKASFPNSRRAITSMFSAGSLLIAVIVLHPFSAPRPDGRLHIDFLDVGQGDSIFVTFPNGKTMLVDGGGRFDYRKTDNAAEAFEPDTRGIGEAVVSEVLWAKGYSSIDHILATHADADHIQGLTDVAKNFQIGSAVFGRMPMNDPDFVELTQVLQRRGITTETISRGEILTLGDARVEVLYPLQSSDENAASDNNNSVVLRVVYGSRAVLLTGDIERAAEAALVAGGGTLRADIVKVAHHGSRTSSTQQFINATLAQYAIISVGRHSPFGHPHADVASRWQTAGANVMTTGTNGMISVSTDGKDLKIATFQQ